MRVPRPAQLSSVWRTLHAALLYLADARALRCARAAHTLDLKHRCSHGYLCPDSTAVTAESATEGGLEVRTAWDAWAGG